MKRRDFLRALAAVPVAAVLAPLLPAPRAVNGELVELLPIRFEDEVWSLGFKAGWAPTVLDNTRFLRIESWIGT